MLLMGDPSHPHLSTFHCKKIVYHFATMFWGKSFTFLPLLEYNEGTHISQSHHLIGRQTNHQESHFLCYKETKSMISSIRELTLLCDPPSGFVINVL